MTYPSGPEGWQQPAGQVVGGIAYWRKNPLIAASMVPIVMTLVHGRFTATDQFGMTVFDADAGDVSGKLGSLGTFKITVRGQKFALVGRGSIGGMESEFSPGQVMHLQGFVAQFPLATTHNPDPPTLEVWRDAVAAAGAAVH